MTLQQFVNLARNFALSHKQLKGNFFEGAYDEYCNNKDQKYPVMIMTIEPTVTEDLRIGFSALFSFWDRVELDSSNRTQVYGDTEQIGRDWIATLKKIRGCELGSLPTIDHADEQFEDAVAGSFYNLTAYFFSPLNACAVPIIPPTPTPIDGDYLVTESGIYIVTNDGKYILVTSSYLVTDNNEFIITNDNKQIKIT